MTRKKLVNVAEAKAHLPELIERSLRVPGKGKGRFELKRGFDAPLPESILASFEK
jgi:hypothetical protein